MNDGSESNKNVTPAYLTAQELADLFRVSLSTVYNNVRSKTAPWPCTKIGRQFRFSPEQIRQIEAGASSQDSQDTPRFTGKQKIKNQLRGWAA